MKKKTAKKVQKWVKVGVIGVDAGLCWIGDPCYILHKGKSEEDPVPKAIGKDWQDFCRKIPHDKYPIAHQFNYDMGHAGLGVCVTSGFGDGCYPVEVRYEDHKDWGKRIAEVRVKFI